MQLITFKDVNDIHAAMNYGRDPLAQEAFNRLRDEVQGAAYANVAASASFGKYCDAIEGLDDAS